MKTKKPQLMRSESTEILEEVKKYHVMSPIDMVRDVQPISSISSILFLPGLFHRRDTDLSKTRVSVLGC